MFRQDDLCRGLFVVVSGLFVRKAERLNTRLTLGPARTGDLVELAAALGDGRHTYTLSAQSSGSVLLLPIEALNKVFEMYPPLRMRLLEELAREVSRAYLSCCLNRAVHTRRRSGSVRTGLDEAGWECPLRCILEKFPANCRELTQIPAPMPGMRYTSLRPAD